MTDTIVVHHPERPGSAIRVSPKQFLVDLKGEGYETLEGVAVSTSTVWHPEPVPQQPGAMQMVTRQDVSPVLPPDYTARLQALEERERIVAEREVELDTRERDAAVVR